MPPKKQSIPDTRPSFMISFDPTHAYNEVDELTRNQRRKYNRHMRLVRTEPEAAATKTQTYEEVVQTGNDEEGDDSDEKGGKISSEGAEERGGNDSEMDLDRPESPELQTVSSGWRWDETFEMFLPDNRSATAHFPERLVSRVSYIKR